MYKQARDVSGRLTGLAASTAGLFNPALSNRHLDILGGVGEYTLPQRGAGMTLGALVGGYLAEPEDREAGIAIGTGAGYAGSAGLDHLIARGRRNIVQDVIDKNIANKSIVNSTEDDLVDMLKLLSNGNVGKEMEEDAANILAGAYATPAFTYGDPDSKAFGRIVSNYDYMHNLKQNPERIDAIMERLKKGNVNADIRDITRRYIEGNFPGYTVTPDVAKYPFLSHELLERKDMFHNKNRVPGVLRGDFVGKAKEVYGPSVAMGHNSVQVLGDETNLALRTMKQKEIDYMREMRGLTNEGPTLAAIRNTSDMYDVTLRQGEITPWAKSTGKAINQGFDTGKLLSEAEQAVIDPGFLRRNSGRAGRALRQAENAIVSPIAGLFDATAGRGYKSLSKYLTKLL